MKINIPLIRHETWNSLVRDISRRRPLRFDPIPKPRMWRHPWQIIPSWEDGGEKGSKGQWLFRVNPGFVNGVEVTAPTRVKRASERTISRLEDEEIDIKDPDRQIDAFLTEWPYLEITGTRAIGTGAEPLALTGGVMSAGGVKLSYESVPPFFADLGVTSFHSQISGNLDNGIEFTTEGEDAEDARRLQACEVSLWKDRLSAKLEYTEGTPLDGTFGSMNIVYNNLGRVRKNPYLRVSVKFKPPEEPESSKDLLEGFVDPEQDAILLATIYFLSPPGAGSDALMDNTWTPYVKYANFWNLAHSTQNIPDSTPFEPIKLNLPPLAGGIGSSIINNMLAQNNYLLEKAFLAQKRASMKGAFWSL